MTYPTLPPRRASTGNGWRSEEWSPSDLRERRYVVPKFQRPLRWSPDRAASYLQGFVNGEPHTPFVLWAPRGSDRVIVLDGQHRLAALGADVPGRTCPAVRFDLLALRWESGEADGVMTLAPSTVIGRTMLDPWGPLATAEEKAYATHIALVKQRHRSARVPIIERRGEATPSAWRDAYAYFERLNRSVPFTAAELDAFAAFVETT